MDLLFKRYTNPYYFFSNFKNSFSKTILDVWNAEQEDIILNLYLHSFSDKSFNEYKEALLKSSKLKDESINIDDEEKARILKSSDNILKNFSPS